MIGVAALRKTVALAAAVLGLACDADVDSRRACLRIHFGTPAPELVDLEASARAAIVAVFPEDRTALCTGIYIAHDVVVTAAHCVDEDGVGGLLVGDWAANGDQTRVEAFEAHPEQDVALLFVHEAPAGVRPIPPLLDGFGDDWQNRPVEIAGVGLTEGGDAGVLRFAIEPIVEIDERTFVVDGAGRSGACGGDSGGPALVLDASGLPRVAGFLDAGDASCLGRDVYTRADLLADWWPTALQPCDGAA